MEGETQNNISKNNNSRVEIGGVNFVIRTMNQDLYKISATIPIAEKLALPASPKLNIPKPAIDGAKAFVIQQPNIATPSPPKPIISESKPLPTQPQALKPIVVAPPPPAPPVPPKPIAKNLLKEGWALYKTQNYLDALEKFEKAGITANWWNRYKAKRAAQICRRELAKIEKKKENEQKILESKLKTETEKKLKEEQLAQRKIQKALEEKQKARLAEAEEAKRVLQATASKAQHEAEAQAKQIAETEARQKAEQQKREEIAKQEALRAETLRQQQAEVEKIRVETARKAEEEKKRQESEKQAREQAILQAQLEAEKTRLRQEALAEQEKQKEIAKRAEMARITEEEKKKREAEARAKHEFQTAPTPPKTISPPVALPIEKPTIPAPIKKKIIWPRLAITAAILIIISTAIYWINSQKKPEPIAPIIPIIEVKPPTPLFAVDIKETIDFTGKINKTNLITALSNIIEKEQTTATFKQIIIQESISGKTNYFSVNNLLSLLNFSGISADNFMFFAYSQENLPKNPFEAGLGSNRIGLIIQCSDSIILKNLLDNWRDNLITNLAPLLLPQQLTLLSGAIDDKNFIETAYKGVTINYLNLPNKYFSIDYAVVGNQLIFATSQESMEAVINKLLP